MTIYEYLSNNPKLSKAQMARDIGISINALYKYIGQEREPALYIAIRFVEYSNYVIQFEDLLIDKTRAKLPKDVEIRPRKKRTKVKIKKKEKSSIDIDDL